MMRKQEGWIETEYGFGRTVDVELTEAVRAALTDHRFLTGVLMTYCGITSEGTIRIRLSIPKGDVIKFEKGDDLSKFGR